MISFSEYLVRLNELLDNSKKLIVDIEKTSSSIYFVETLYRDDIHKHTSDYRYATAKFKNWQNIKDWTDEIKSKNNKTANQFLFWEITKYDDEQKVGSRNNKVFALILDNEYNSIDVSFEKSLLRENDICSEIQPLIVEWKDLGMLSYKDEICEYPFENGDIVVSDIPWLSEKHMYIFVGNIEEQQGNWFVDMNCRNIIGGKNIDIKRINDSNLRMDTFAYIGYLRKVDFDECSDALTKMGADLVKNDSDFMSYLDKMRKIDKFEPEQKEMVSEQTKQYIYKTYGYDWCKNGNETQTTVILSQNELKSKISDILERTRKTIFVDCNEREIYNVKMKLRKNADDLAEYEKRKGCGIFKKYSDVNALILNYPYRASWTTLEIDESVKEYMYFEVEKCVLNSANQYVCICRMIFTAIDGKLVDVKFFDNIEKYCFNDEVLRLYEDWNALINSIKEAKVKMILLEYGDVLKVDLQPLYDIAEFVYLGNGNTNSIYGMLKISEEDYELTNLNNKLYIGLDVARIWMAIKKCEPKDVLLKKLSDLLKKKPELEAELSELEDEEEYFVIHKEKLEGFLDDYRV